MCVHFDLQASSCVNKEWSHLTGNYKTMKTFSHMHLCNMSTNRDHFTSHGLHLNPQGKNCIINKWVSIITPIISKSRIMLPLSLGWKKVIIIMMIRNIGMSLLQKDQLCQKINKVYHRKKFSSLLQKWR